VVLIPFLQVHKPAFTWFDRQVFRRLPALLSLPPDINWVLFSKHLGVFPQNFFRTLPLWSHVLRGARSSSLRLPFKYAFFLFYFPEDHSVPSPLEPALTRTAFFPKTWGPFPFFLPTGRSKGVPPSYPGRFLFPPNLGVFFVSSPGVRSSRKLPRFFKLDVTLKFLAPGLQTS